MSGVSQSADTMIETIADIFERRGAHSYLGEQVTMSQHMLQAAQQADRAGATADLIVAALLHDIGHYIHEFPEEAFDTGIDKRHDTAGARFLGPFFPASVTEPVRLHVAAKRYLCAVDPAYAGRLSPASVHTLSLQGGPMSREEIAAFEAEPFHAAALRVRAWDEAAKVKGAVAAPFVHYVPLLRRLTAAR